MEKNKHMLVVSAHALDFLWRAGGTMAHYAKLGWDVRVICLTFGERGESDSLWENNPGITEEAVKKLRKEEASEAAKKLGCTQIDFFDWSDHLLETDRIRIEQIAKVIKQFRPSIILTQHSCDTLNFDHPNTCNAVLEAVRMARVAGVFPELKKLPFPSVFMYDPSQPEFLDFKPDVFIDITNELDIKVDAMQVAAKSQAYLIENYNTRARYRGMNANMFCGDKSIKYAEAFQRFRPYVGKEFC